MTKLSLPSISIHAPVPELAECMEGCHGVLLLQDLPEAPFEPILELLQHSTSVTNRLNQAYNPNNLIYKDSYATTAGSGDRKRSLDLSPERLEIIAKAEPDLVQSQALQQPLEFFKAFQELVGEKILPALAQVIGSNEILNDINFHYRMLDYYPSPANKATAAAAPRCAEHRDFGFLTLIQATHPGLQVRVDHTNKWHKLPPIPNGSAIMLFGWCTKIRSNGRIPAVLHRVGQHHLDANNKATSRIAAVLFCNPTQTDTPLEPIMRPGETRKYIRGVNVGELNSRLVESKVEKSVDRWLEQNGSNKEKKERFRTMRPRKFWKSFWRPT